MLGVPNVRVGKNVQSPVIVTSHWRAEYLSRGRFKSAKTCLPPIISTTLGKLGQRNDNDADCAVRFLGYAVLRLLTW